jgi:transcriptional regulator of acetoin/glycerol metabolism
VPESADKSGEAEVLLNALRKCRWNKTMAARLLGMSRRTFYRKLAQYGLQEEEPDTV